MPATDARACRASSPGPVARTVARMPPTSFFLISAVFHYLGPSLAVLLFAHVAAPGVAWLRIASAAAVFALGAGPGVSSPRPAPVSGWCSPAWASSSPR